MMDVPFAQAPLYGGEVVVRSTLGTSAVVGAIRAVTNGMDKNLPVTDIVPLADVLGASVAQPRFRTWLLGLFGGIALILAAVGILGVISYSVSRRTHEMGIRLALGAQPGSVLSMILCETLALTVIGIAVGIPCAVVAARLIAHLLFNVTPYDPVTLALVPVVLLAVGALASYIPARRAMKVDPLVALRHEGPHRSLSTPDNSGRILPALAATRRTQTSLLPGTLEHGYGLTLKPRFCSLTYDCFWRTLLVGGTEWARRMAL